MLKIIFSEKGESVSDFEVRSRAKGVIENYLKEKKIQSLLYLMNAILIFLFYIL